MELFSNQPAWIERDEILVESTLVEEYEREEKQSMKEKAELFLAVIKNVCEPGRSYINEYSWLFGAR